MLREIVQQSLNLAKTGLVKTNYSTKFYAQHRFSSFFHVPECTGADEIIQISHGTIETDYLLIKFDR
jgi:hypothetical protein